MDAINFHESLVLFVMVLFIMQNPDNLKLTSYENEEYRSEQSPTEDAG
jgi:hypothetical protein